MSLNKIIQITKEILECKYPHAKVIFLAGSIVRGEGTAYSDLDLVVIFEKLQNAYRESFSFQGFPVEAVVHDPETLNYFLNEVDGSSGIPALAQMILEGTEIPEASEFSDSLKRLASSVVERGPSPLSDENIRKLQYNVTNLVDDIRYPRSKEELIASGTQLYGALADYYFRRNNLWSAKGKSIPRILKQTDADLWVRYCMSFKELFTAGHPEKVIALVEEILNPDGGFLFDGHKLDAPADCRKPLG